MSSDTLIPLSDETEARPEDGRVNILLVDDQPAKLLSYEAMLSQLGENLIKANSGKEALHHLLRHEVTVVLMDVSMPDLDGFELAEIIRQHPRYQKTAIIFVSAVHLTDLDRLKGYESGAVDYVSVPVIPELLRAKVSVFTELYRKTRESERLTRELEQRVIERTAELEAASQRQMELADRLLEADRRKDEFLSLLAHELRNPLAPVRNAVNIMRLKEIEDPDIRNCRDLIERQTDQLARLVDDLLDVSRITLGKIKLRLEPISLCEVISDAIETSRPLIDARRHHLVLTKPEHAVSILGDRARLMQIFSNLLNNAAKYQEDFGRIDLIVHSDGPTVTVTVADRGEGLTAEMLPQIFQLFWQNERSMDTRQGGLGIGLSLVKNLVEMHQGEIRVHSDGPGKGAEFSVTLPALPQTAAHPVTIGETQTVSATQVHRILVVDDNRDAAESLAILLRMNGHEVTVAYDGPSALEITGSMRPSVVLLDIGLPGMDGYEVCRRFRAQGLVDASIIAMTGYGQDRDRERSRAAGFDRHTVKPVAIDELMQLLSPASA